MSKQIQVKLRPEVAELERLLSEADKASPELWATIKQSVCVAELTTNSIQAEETKGTVISSDAETTSRNEVKEV